MPGYDFTRDFFSPCIPFWQEHLAPFVGRPGVRYLEVGVFEGRSFTWMIDHVLTAPDARATAVDVFYPSADYEARFRRNVALTGMAGRVEILNGPSAELLRGFPPAAFDLVYVDGSHSPGPVFCDLANAWVALAPGGVMILDDYELHPHFPPELRIAPVIDTFLTAFAHELVVLHKGWQVMLRRVPPRGVPALVPERDNDLRTRLGAWHYYWNQELLVADDGRTLKVSDRRALRWLERAVRNPVLRPWLARLLEHAPDRLLRVVGTVERESLTPSR